MTLLFRLLPAGLSRDGFSCGNKALDVYWRAQAGQDQKWGFATVVIAGDAQTSDKVISFYTLAAAQRRRARSERKKRCFSAYFGPYGLKCQAFQTETALEQDDGSWGRPPKSAHCCLTDKDIFICVKYFFMLLLSEYAGALASDNES